MKEEKDTDLFEPRSGSENPSKSSERDATAKRGNVRRQKKSKRDKISIDSMIALYMLRPSNQPMHRDIGNILYNYSLQTYILQYILSVC